MNLVVRRLPFIAVLALLCTWPGPAVGDVFRYPDGDDATGPIDMAWVSHGHFGEGVLEHRIGTIKKWEIEDVRRKGVFGLDINMTADDRPPTEDDGQDIDYCASVVFGKRARGEMVDCRIDFDGPVVGPVTVLHPKPKLLILRFPESYLQPGGPYEYNVQAVWYGKGCADACPDFAPGDSPIGLYGQHPGD